MGCSAPGPQCTAGLHSAVPVKPDVGCFRASCGRCAAGVSWEDKVSLLLSVPDLQGEPGRRAMQQHYPRSGPKMGGRCHHLKIGDKELHGCTPLSWPFPGKQERAAACTARLTASVEARCPPGFGSCPHEAKGAEAGSALGAGRGSVSLPRAVMGCCDVRLGARGVSPSERGSSLLFMSGFSPAMLQDRRSRRALCRSSKMPAPPVSGGACL